ncbi:MAG TPA: LuxR C-terminal-related transcriptional regulator [Actinoplanes sp.]|nr:LuxR C-terminal-related transcriptional regulator [Actinoplanes sp.]
MDPRQLIERNGPLTALGRILGDARAGSGTLTVFSGGVGTGKSALVEVALSQAREAGFNVLHARGNYLERDDDGELLRRLLGMLSPTSDAARGTHPQMVDGNAAISAATVAGPVLIALDDIQFADRTTLRWLAALTDRAQHLPVATLLTVCNGEPSVDDPLLDELLTAATAEESLGPLTSTGVSELLGRALATTPDLDFIARCLVGTGGNAALVAALAEIFAGDLSISDDPERALAELARSRAGRRLQVRLHHASPDAVQVVLATAALGEFASPRRIHKVVDLDRPTVSEIIATLTRMGLLAHREGTVVLHPPVLRRVLELTHPLTARHDLHRRTATALHDAGTHPRHVAEHLLLSAPGSSDWARDVLAGEAEHHLEEGRPEVAVGYLRRALEEDGGERDRRQLVAALGRAASYYDPPTAIRYLTEATMAAEPDRDDRTAATLARTLAMTGQYSRAIEVATSQAGRVGAHGTATRLALLHAATSSAGMQWISEQAGNSLDQGAAAPQLSLLALRNTWVGTDLPGALEAARRALARTPIRPDTADLQLDSVNVLLHAGEITDAEEHLTALESAATACGHLPWRAATLALRALVLRGRGRLEAASAAARQSLELYPGCDAGVRRGAAAEFVARSADLLIGQGRLEEAESILVNAGLMGELRLSLAGNAVLFTRGRLAVAGGRPRDGARLLMMAGRRVKHWPINNPAVMPWRSEAAIALARMGMTPRAVTLAAEEVRLARLWGTPGPIAMALRAQGLVSGEGQGLEALRAAVVLADQSPDQLTRAHCRTDYGAALVLAGRHEDARPVLRTAVQLAGDCGASDLSRRATDGLVTSGARPQRTSGKTGTLTFAERRVVTHAVTGLTNREIAEKLFIQCRTVEIHLTNSYRKLGIRGRDELEQTLTDAGTIARTAP